MDLEKILGANVRGFRKQQRLTQALFGQRSGIHRDFIAGIERGERNITMETLKKVAIALGIQPFVLLIPDSHKWTNPSQTTF
ncbi:MAG TPA: helix-turn-helix transcriptional regulator [Candidatus Kapabacteria bacterium]|nr:helix-turn-helix transcriptional regulator [Candidatus Kapabacteria bacterium]